MALYSAYASSACRRAVAFSSWYASQPPRKVLAVRVWSSSSTTSVTVRSRKARSWLTTTRARRCSSTHVSSRSSPARSRSLVGSSRRMTSWPATSSERERGLGRLAARQRAHRLVEHGQRQAESRPRSPRPWCRGRRRRGPATCAARCRSARPRRRGGGQRRRGQLELRGRRRDARAAAHERPHRLPRPPLRLLVEQADGRARAAARSTRPPSGRTRPARTLSSVDLPTPFGPDQAVAVPGRDGEADPVEDGQPADGHGDVAGDEGGRHRRCSVLPPPYHRPRGFLLDLGAGRAQGPGPQGGGRRRSTATAGPTTRGSTATRKEFATRARGPRLDRDDVAGRVRRRRPAADRAADRRPRR